MSNNNRIFNTMFEGIEDTPRVFETKKKKVSSIGTVSLTSRLAGQTVLVRDNEDGTYTIFTKDSLGGYYE